MPTPSAPPLPTELAVRAVGAPDLVPGPGLGPVGFGRWAVTAPHVRLTAAARLEPGWYEVRLAAESADRFAVRKRLELTLDPGDADPRPVAREAFAWNRRFEEAFLLRLTRPASAVRLDVWHAEGLLALDEFQVRRVSPSAVLARALRAKVRLTRAYQCFTPALVRGGRLLLRGRLREFGAKLVKGLTDARVMQLDGAADGVWRRSVLSAGEAERVRRAVDAMPEPPPLAVLLPVDPIRSDAARRSAHSVRRQLYPHWQLLVAVAGPAEEAEDLERSLGWDSRLTVVRAATAAAVAAAGCERVVVLPPGVELAEHALYHLAAAVKADPAAVAIGGRIAGEQFVWSIRTDQLPDGRPVELTPQGLADWATRGVPAERRTVVEPVLTIPVGDRLPVSCDKPLVLAADLRGVGGYDHVAFEFLRGLASVGVDLRMHHRAAVRGELIPPDLLRPHVRRKPGDPQLVLAPPFLVGRFDPDRASAVYTMWETDALAADQVRVLNRAGLVIVPSRWQVECFRGCGVTAPVEVVPLGHDPLVYRPAGTFPAVCTFGTAGALVAGGVRKNVQRVIDLFREAFSDEPGVRLRVKLSPGSAGVETYDDPRIDVLRAALPREELADWYRSLTAYANASAGEGFGLHLLEAMACGRPLVSPCHSGLTAFFDPSVGYPVEYALVPARGTDFYSGRWAEPDAASLVARMREVFADRSRAERLGAAAAGRAAAFTWEATARGLVDVLRRYGFLSSRSGC